MPSPLPSLLPYALTPRRTLLCCAIAGVCCGLELGRAPLHWATPSLTHLLMMWDECWVLQSHQPPAATW